MPWGFYYRKLDYKYFAQERLAVPAVEVAEIAFYQIISQSILIISGNIEDLKIGCVFGW